MLVDLKKTEFAPAGVQAGSSSRTFHPEATGAGGKVQSKKNYTGWNANSYINTYNKLILKEGKGEEGRKKKTSLGLLILCKGSRWHILCLNWYILIPKEDWFFLKLFLLSSLFI